MNTSIVGVVTYLKTILLGVLLSEAWILGEHIAQPVNSYFSELGWFPYSVFVNLIALVLLVAYSYLRDLHRAIKMRYESRRVDLLVCFLFGVSASQFFDGFGKRWYKYASQGVHLEEIFFLVAIPFLIAFVCAIRSIQKKYYLGGNKSRPIFMNDEEKRKAEDDLLDHSEKARRFAERVYNDGSSDCIIFGIDAPWGIGKSSFVNLCQHYWEKEAANKVIVYKFNPIRYENSSNLLVSFVDGLIKSIQEKIYLPEISPLISRYSRFIRGKGTISFLGLSMEFSPESNTIEQAFSDLESVLGDLDRKVVIVVDDLDRLSFASIKEVLFVVKKCFTLPNISYVLCYDTENISAMEEGEVGQEKITEFLEKFVNVKMSLYLDSAILEKYVTSNLPKALSENCQSDPVLVSKAVGGLIDIYRSPEFHHYLPFVGDIRKIKRLINTILLLDIDKTDFENSDFLGADLIKLLLIYINFPNIFRKIYNTETNAKYGFFTLVSPYESNYPEQGDPGMNQAARFKNSSLFSEFIANQESNSVYLLNAVFDVRVRLESSEISEVSDYDFNTLACFNGTHGGKANLNNYLKLIVSHSEPEQKEQHVVYLNAKKEIESGKRIEEILSNDIFSFSKGEFSHKKFWKLVVNSAFDFDIEVSNGIIRYLMEHIHHYSHVADHDNLIGLRSNLVNYLIVLLDKAGWHSSKGTRRHNSPENISEIAEWIFGEGRHSGEGVIDTLSTPSRGVLGFYDLMIFRLYSCADRGGDIFNLTRSLSLHGSADAPVSGAVNHIVISEMRLLSQRAFKIFKERYIDDGINIFSAVDNVSRSEMFGSLEEYIDARIEEEGTTISQVEEKIEQQKSTMKSFIVYQLTNQNISGGIGCGYYDETGANDNGSICKLMNDYLFDTCFSPELGKNNFLHFLDFLIRQLERDFFEEGRSPTYTFAITHALDAARVKNYWNSFKNDLREMSAKHADRLVITSNFSVTYSYALDIIFVALERLDEMNAADAEA